MSAQEIKAAFDYRRTMRDYLESGAVMDGADDWIRMELHNQEREMRRDVAAVLREERQQERRQEMKSARMAVRAQGLRGRLKHLISSILSHPAAPVKDLKEESV